MPKIDLKLGDSFESTASKIKIELTEANVPVVFKEKIPCNWHIIASDEGIVATSYKGDSYKGSISEFNKLLRG